ncbi:uncharacterized protein LOC100899809 [Galendromus occidentalis]|uniref:Uncharacterized protein LOC100899809 n=1 Tax=Galendromus occidentalis TaxID=34638 RepID=A0AAJ6VUL6_9ACAR|nr:uncharacterized protein LOC100899809 [Galendromus occidentalis]
MGKVQRGRRKYHDKVSHKKIRNQLNPNEAGQDGPQAGPSGAAQQPVEQLGEPVAMQDEQQQPAEEFAGEAMVEETLGEAMDQFMEDITEETIEEAQPFFCGKPIFFSDLPARFRLEDVPLYSRTYLPFAQCDVCSSYSVRAVVVECGHKFCENCVRLSKVGRGVLCLFCQKQMPYNVLEVAEDFLARRILQCRCGLEAPLIDMHKHIVERGKRCYIPKLPIKHLMTCNKYHVKSKRWPNRISYLVPGALYNLRDIQPPQDSKMFLETTPRNPNLPHVYIDLDADGLFLGRLHIELREDIVPKTVAEFIDLITDSKGYKGQEIDFIIPNTLLQMSGLTGYGKSVKKSFPDENYELKHDRPGALAMSNIGAGTSQSGFYITTTEMPWRDGNNVVFGYVISGDQIVRRTCELGRQDGTPFRRVRIRDCGLIRDWILPAVYYMAESDSESDP